MRSSNRGLANHLAVSAILEPKTGKLKEWRLVTNLPAEHLGRVPKLYGQRMSPEEVHRDSKRGFAVSGFGLGHLGRLRLDRLERLIFMWGLIYGYLVLVAETKGGVTVDMSTSNLTLGPTTSHVLFAVCHSA